MRDFKLYSPEDTIAVNLRENANRLRILAEQDMSHLRDLAYEAVEGRDLQEILLTLPDLLAVDALPLENAIFQNKDALNRLSNAVSINRKLLLCYSICELLRKKTSFTFDAFFSDAPILFNENPHIIYQKSGYTDSAYLYFSSFFKESHATYTHGFVSACEDVYNGLCDYCILPIESSSEGLLGSFFKLILKYDLKIAATCEIFEKSKERMTRFALLRRTLLPLFEKDGSDTFFELVFSNTTPSGLTDLLGAATFFGIDLSNVNSFPNDEEPDGLLVHLLFSTTAGDPEGFLMYLSMEFPQYIPIGLYPHLSTKKERT